MRTRILIKHFRRSNLTDPCVLSTVSAALRLDDWQLMVLDGSHAEQPYRLPWSAEVSFPVSIQSVPIDAGLIASFNPFMREADFYVCLNNDTVLHPRCLIGMEQVVRTHPEVGIIAPLYDDPGGGWLYREPPRATPGTIGWRDVLESRLAPSGAWLSVPHVDNCGWGIAQRLIEAIGLPDEAFQGAGWGSNLDYCYRARQAGFRVAVSLGSYLHHVGAATYGEDPDYRRNAERARDAALRQKYPDPSVVWG